jgi:hypothetical protein
LEAGRLDMAVRKGFRNWETRFKESFGKDTRLSQISVSTLYCLAQGKGDETFYLYDLIMNLKGWGSGFEFNELNPKKKMAVIDRYLVLLDLIRFECMKRLGWLKAYPGEEYALVEVVLQFPKLAPLLQAGVPELDQNHSGYRTFASLSTFDKEAFVRKLIPKALKEIQDYSSTTR